ncbi:TetR/AcrR family transcriptional regulator [Cryptosporangium arvum]|uniref:TetR/AcrR family transcriptional regulator n=1 Tax=Cryptosporangium arvum TaxID=80871 RepID=UPI0004B8ADE0|nr:TetR/AcrR family transcriptional regulator [Cryptosporangium arvum]
MDVLWGERPAPRRGPRPAFDRERIARAGIEIADREGLAAVTMQRVAESLGVTKMALYRYLPGKAELVALMVDIGIGAPPAPGGAGWREALALWARELFVRFHQHPWTLEATRGARPVGPNELGWMEVAVAALAGSGLDGAETLDTVVVLTGHVRALGEQTVAFGTVSAEDPLTTGVQAILAGREDRFPAVSAAFASAAASGNQNQALDYGVDRILDGVAALIASRR